MKVVLLAGGYGTRLAEYTELIPKPMVTIGDKPIIWHIMNHYASWGYDQFCVALGYKASVIKDYFLNYHSLNSDFTIDLSNGGVIRHGYEDQKWQITLADTGLETMTGGRIKRMKKFIGNEPFMFTYGDGLANVDINSLVKFHKEQKKILTMTVVRPTARFGEVKFIENKVSRFEEKPQLHDGWINGGFFVAEPEIFDYISDDSIMFEREPIQALVDIGQIAAFNHHGFWQCMDTKRDRDYLEALIGSGSPPWLRDK